MSVAFKHYRKRDKKGRRLAIFAEDAGDNILAVYTFTCSLDDQFSKKQALEIYNEYKAGAVEKYHPSIITVPIVDNKPLKSFLDWTNKNYYEFTVFQVHNAVIDGVARQKADGEVEMVITGKIRPMKY